MTASHAWRDSRGLATSRSSGPILGSVPQHPQLHKLEALIITLTAARADAARGVFFASRAGMAATKAAFDLFECDGLYTLKQDIEHEIGEGRE